MYERDGFVKSYLDGDGMVTSIAIKDGKAYFRNKFVRTEHFDKEEELGRYTETEHLHRERSEKAGVVLQIV